MIVRIGNWMFDATPVNGEHDHRMLFSRTFPFRTSFVWTDSFEQASSFQLLRSLFLSIFSLINSISWEVFECIKVNEDDSYFYQAHDAGDNRSMELKALSENI